MKRRRRRQSLRISEKPRTETSGIPARREYKEKYTVCPAEGCSSWPLGVRRRRGPNAPTRVYLSRTLRTRLASARVIDRSLAITAFSTVRFTPRRETAIKHNMIYIKIWNSRMRARLTQGARVGKSTDVWRAVFKRGNVWVIAYTHTHAHTRTTLRTRRR